MKVQPTKLVEGRLGRLNRGLLAFRVGLYTALAGALIASGLPGSGAAALLVAALSIVPALPVRILERRRIETGIAISLALEAGLWARLAAIPVLDLLPILSVLVAGLLLSRRSAVTVTAAAVGIQLLQTALWFMRAIPVEATAAGLLGEAVLILVVGLGFVEVGAVLREYQARVVEQSREEIRLTELIDEKDRLISTVAHELRTPLTAVLGLSTELATSTFSAEDAGSLAGIVADEARRLSGIVDNLVVAARLEIDRLGSAPEDIDLGDLAHRTWTTVSGGAGGCRVIGEATVLGDVGRMTHLLTNLFDNVVRHGHTPVELEIRRDGNRVTATMRDSGPGIADSSAGAVFERYRAGDASTRPDNLGLGLPVSRTLARHMGGDLEIVDGWATLHMPASSPVAVGLPA